MMSWTGRFL